MTMRAQKKTKNTGKNNKKAKRKCLNLYNLTGNKAAFLGVARDMVGDMQKIYAISAH